MLHMRVQKKINLYTDSEYIVIMLQLPVVLSSNTVLVGGSVGPYGACQFDRSEYHGDYVDQMTTEVSMFTVLFSLPLLGDIYMK